MSKNAWLSGYRPDGQPGEWPLKTEEFLIGREEPADLVIPLPRVSRRHARLAYQESGYYLVDLDSRNGTFVNGQQVGRDPRRLQNGDELVFGGVATFYFHDPAETAAGPRLGRLNGVWIDELNRDVWVDGRLVAPPLSPAQFTLLLLLVQQAGKVVSRAEVVATVWPGVSPEGVSQEAVDGLIKRLRARLKAVQPEREYIEVRRDYGLRLNQPGEV
ncbi:MAG: FHA domain-containing protein [Chloroflexi bacterium]|nr:FHA domain-containing protein [Chloroflexota bacterium]MCI0575685.1 FHA domain-containing protein [Chloroflexota bacterium]MCI0647816.1 FHA domain-containing protein [Chloroflexota bacterium]MCI0725180.1 FHA domain-containing protein [Chloroflexota bacterium]